MEKAVTFSDLNLQIATGHGVWSHTQSVTNDDWDAAENTLALAAQTFLGTDKGVLVNGYNCHRDEDAKTLRLDLMRGA